MSIFITLATQHCAGREQEEEGLQQSNGLWGIVRSPAVIPVPYVPSGFDSFLKKEKTGNNCIIARLRPKNPAGCTSLSAVH